MTRSTGDPDLDDLLGGGVPDEYAVVLRGGPGAGKTQIAVSFLRTGAENGESCLYATFEETVRANPLADDDVEIAEVDLDDDSMRLRGGRAEKLSEDAANEPIENAILDGGYDRVVVDDVASVAAGAPDERGFRRGLVSLVDRCRRSDATCIVTAGDDATGTTLGHAASGLIDCWQESTGGGLHRFVQVRKLAGVDHDPRKHKLSVTDAGPAVVSRDRAGTTRYLPAGIDGFEEFEGGFVRGGTTVFEHGQGASHWPFTVGVCSEIIERGATVVLITALGTALSHVDRLLENQIGTLGEAMENDDLYLIETVAENAETGVHAPLPEKNVVVQAEEGSLQESIRTLMAELSGVPVLAVFEVEPTLHLLDENTARRLFYWASANVLALDGFSLVLTANRSVAGDELVDFFVGSASQTLETRVGADGLQYLTPTTSPSGRQGETRVVEPIDDPPYVRLR